MKHTHRIRATLAVAMVAVIGCGQSSGAPTGVESTVPASLSSTVPAPTGPSPRPSATEPQGDFWSVRLHPFRSDPTRGATTLGRSGSGGRRSIH